MASQALRQISPSIFSHRDQASSTLVEDFGELAAQPVEIGGQRFADPARRWAVVLDTGNLVFANTDQLVAE